MKTFVIYMDLYIPNRRGTGGRVKTTRIERQSVGAWEATVAARAEFPGQEVSMFWPK